MATTDNGWLARRDLPLRPLVVEGVAFVPGIVDDDAVAAVLGYVAEQFHRRVEPLRNPGCWGFSYRENRNNPNALSRHSGGIAIDANAPAHPNGVPTARTFTQTQIAEVHRILAEVDHVVRWGGDYTGTPDAMHFEINADRTAVQAVAARLEDDMANADEVLAAVEKLTKRVDRMGKNTAARDRRIRDMLLSRIDQYGEKGATAAQLKRLRADVALALADEDTEG